MQALSLGVHIPLVCFGISFPAIVLFMEGLYLRTGNPVYKAVAKRWSKVMLILFAIGVVTGTILSFELGLLWPQFMEQLGEVFGFAFAIEGLAFFVEAIFIAIYVYGWDRLAQRDPFPLRAGRCRGRDPRIDLGDRGQRVDEQPAGLHPQRGWRDHRRPPVLGAVQPEPLARGSPHVPRGLHRRERSGRRRLRRRVAAGPARPLPPRRPDRAARGPRRLRLPLSSSSATGRRAPSRRSSRPSSRRSRGSTRPPTTPPDNRRDLPRRQGARRHLDPVPALAARLPRPDGNVQGLDAVPQSTAHRLALSATASR